MAPIRREVFPRHLTEEEIQQGHILFLKPREKIDKELLRKYSIKSGVFRHPVLILQSLPVSNEVLVCILTTLNNKNLEDRYQPSRHEYYIAIHPKHAPSSDHPQLRLANGVITDKHGYLSIRDKYKVDPSMLQLYEDTKPADHYRLNAISFWYLAQRLDIGEGPIQRMKTAWKHYIKDKARRKESGAHYDIEEDTARIGDSIEVCKDNVMAKGRVHLVPCLRGVLDAHMTRSEPQFFWAELMPCDFYDEEGEDSGKLPHYLAAVQDGRVIPRLQDVNKELKAHFEAVEKGTAISRLRPVDEKLKNQRVSKYPPSIVEMGDKENAVQNSQAVGGEPNAAESDGDESDGGDSDGDGSGNGDGSDAGDFVGAESAGRDLNGVGAESDRGYFNGAGSEDNEFARGESDREVPDGEDSDGVSSDEGLFDGEHSEEGDVIKESIDEERVDEEHPQTGVEEIEEKRTNDHSRAVQAEINEESGGDEFAGAESEGNESDGVPSDEGHPDGEDSGEGDVIKQTPKEERADNHPQAGPKSVEEERTNYCSRAVQKLINASRAVIKKAEEEQRALDYLEAIHAKCRGDELQAICKNYGDHKSIDLRQAVIEDSQDEESISDPRAGPEESAGVEHTEEPESVDQESEDSPAIDSAQAVIEYLENLGIIDDPQAVVVDKPEDKPVIDDSLALIEKKSTIDEEIVIDHLDNEKPSIPLDDLPKDVDNFRAANEPGNQVVAEEAMANHHNKNLPNPVTAPAEVGENIQASYRLVRGMCKQLVLEEGEKPTVVNVTKVLFLDNAQKDSAQQAMSTTKTQAAMKDARHASLAERFADSRASGQKIREELKALRLDFEAQKRMLSAFEEKYSPQQPGQDGSNNIVQESSSNPPQDQPNQTPTDFPTWLTWSIIQSITLTIINFVVMVYIAHIPIEDLFDFRRTTSLTRPEGMSVRQYMRLLDWQCWVMGNLVLFDAMVMLVWLGIGVRGFLSWRERAWVSVLGVMIVCCCVSLLHSWWGYG